MKQVEETALIPKGYIERVSGCIAMTKSKKFLMGYFINIGVIQGRITPSFSWKDRDVFCGTDLDLWPEVRKLAEKSFDKRRLRHTKAPKLP